MGALRSYGNRGSLHDNFSNILSMLFIFRLNVSSFLFSVGTDDWGIIISIIFW